MHSYVGLLGFAAARRLGRGGGSDGLLCQGDQKATCSNHEELTSSVPPFAVTATAVPEHTNGLAVCPCPARMRCKMPRVSGGDGSCGRYFFCVRGINQTTYFPGTAIYVCIEVQILPSSMFVRCSTPKHPAPTCGRVELQRRRETPRKASGTGDSRGRTEGEGALKRRVVGTSPSPVLERREGQTILSSKFS